MIRYLIVDDEPLAHEIIEGFSEQFPKLKKAANCYSAFEAIEFLQSARVDLLFLDINMPRFSGFEMLKTLASPPKVIVTSAYQEYAIEGYSLNVIDYLLKPFSFERFVQAINKLTIVATPTKITESAMLPERLFIKGDKKQHQINLDDLLYIEAFGNYCKVYLDDTMIVTLQKISDFEKMLPTTIFIRVHKSFVVSKPKITAIEGNLIHVGAHTIPIGQTYKKIIRNWFNG